MPQTSEQRCPGCFEAIGGLRRCNLCGYDQDADRSALYLPHLSLLDEQFLVGRVLGRPGGFGITYLGWDINLQRKLAIKEYLPKRIATRGDNGTDVVLRPGTDPEEFEFGRTEFLAEARTVARFDHPNVVRVRNFFRANQTAYLVMDYYSGISLADHLSDNQSQIPVATAIGIIRPILAGLQLIHDHGYLHRDVKPGNIYLASIGRPILLDFGAARLATSAHNADSAVVLTDGYAPLEQYQRGGTQGPWTDVYGAAATLYRLISGGLPPMAMDRVGAEDVPWPNDVPDLTPQLRSVVERAMAVHIDERTAIASEFSQALDAAMDRDSSSRRRLLEPVPEPQAVKAAETSAAPLRAFGPRSGRRPWPQALLLIAAGWLLLVLQDLASGGSEWALRSVSAEAPWPAAPARPVQAHSAVPTPAMLTVPAGPLREDDPGSELPAFAITAAPVSVAAFRRFVEQRDYFNARWNAVPCRSPGGSPIASWEAPGRAQEAADPVVCIDWHDARAYAAWLSEASERSFRLPTKAQWTRMLRLRQPGDSLANQFWSCSAAEDTARPDSALRCHAPREGDSALIQLLGMRGTAGGVAADTRSSDTGFYLVEELN